MIEDSLGSFALRNENPMRVFHGTVQKLIYNHHDDLDGWVLQDGTLVHFPPHIGEELSEWIDVGDDVELTGELRKNRNGEQVIFPEQIQSQGWILEFEQKKPRPRDDDNRHAPKRSDKPVTNEEILRELKVIREILESWQNGVG